MMENEKPNLSAEPVSRCIKCNVTVESGKRCPLCHTPIRGGGISDVSYPEYVPKYSDNRRFTLFRLFSFLSIVTGVLCTMINIFTFQKGSTLWSAIVITFLLFGWSALFTLRNKHINTAGKTLLFYLLIITGMLLIDIWSGFDKWSTTYVIPFVTMAVILYVTLLASIG
ncbi:MAG: DUF6320 domain-containing protein, partial [Ruminococcus sp.]|nr:DUF6320 domain-containing protein [Ruminococcus sp.]